MGGRRQRGVQGELLASDDGGENVVPEAEAGPPPGDAAPTSSGGKAPPSARSHGAEAVGRGGGPVQGDRAGRFPQREGT